MQDDNLTPGQISYNIMVAICKKPVNKPEARQLVKDLKAAYRRLEKSTPEQPSKDAK